MNSIVNKNKLKRLKYIQIYFKYYNFIRICEDIRSKWCKIAFVDGFICFAFIARVVL